MHASTVAVQLAKYNYVIMSKRLLFGSLSVYVFACFAVVAQNITDPHPRHEVPYENHAFARFGNNSISHTQMAGNLRCGAFT